MLRKQLLVCLVQYGVLLRGAQADNYLLMRNSEYSSSLPGPSPCVGSTGLPERVLRDGFTRLQLASEKQGPSSRVYPPGEDGGVGFLWEGRCERLCVRTLECDAQLRYRRFLPLRRMETTA
ncbi:hypothetical protein F4821DRAFT_237775 [Hypoxylon rubiginosum]|uniref:Uncharacterized protein n=1 Tax=Hypoxylon rubiginosum TaxID=110542 RepID=A0ACC0D2F8_9PEZI|nr:hypothetical protein F4821DRAFT_237775 [Hypoxylon rubiginosum]